MNLNQLLKLVSRAKSEQPPKAISDYCGEYYSPYYHFMYLAAQQIKGYCVELGCEKGRGLVSLALSGRIVIGIESQPRDEISEVLEMYPNIDFYERSSLPVEESLFVNGVEIGLLHIDTEHSYSQAKNEFEAYEPYLADEAIIIFDDLHAMNDDVLKYFLELPYDKVQDDELHPSCGWGVMLYAK